jgi:GxxExxY protein
MLIDGDLSESIIGDCIEVHSELGPGLLESAYQRWLAREFELRGIRFREQVPLPVRYKGIELDCGYRMDFVIEEKIVLEIKAVEKLIPVHKAQLLTYHKLSGYKIGLLANVHSAVIRNSIIRRVL